MSKKRQPKRRYSTKVARFFVGLILTAVILFPLVSTAAWAKELANIDSRKVTEQSKLQHRDMDNNTDPHLFEEPLLTVTFDDGWESIYTDALPLFQKYGIRTTQYVLSGVMDDRHYMSLAQLQSLKKAGHQISCHSVNHPDLTTLDDEDLSAELIGCQDYLMGHVGLAQDFASPYGSQNDRTIDAIKQVYRSQRNTEGDIYNGVSEDDVNLPSNFNRYNLIAVTIRSDTTEKQLKELINYGIQHKAWIILNYHQIDDQPISEYGLTNDKLDDQLRIVSQSRVRIVTIDDVISQVVK